MPNGGKIGIARAGLRTAGTLRRGDLMAAGSRFLISQNKFLLQLNSGRDWAILMMRRLDGFLRKRPALLATSRLGCGVLAARGVPAMEWVGASLASEAVSLPGVRLDGGKHLVWAAACQVVRDRTCLGGSLHGALRGRRLRSRGIVGGSCRFGIPGGPSTEGGGYDRPRGRDRFPIGGSACHGYRADGVWR